MANFATLPLRATRPADRAHTCRIDGPIVNIDGKAYTTCKGCGTRYEVPSFLECRPQGYTRSPFQMVRSSEVEDLWLEA